MTPLAGFCAMRFGLRRTLATCVVGFTIVSMLCGAAQSLEMATATLDHIARGGIHDHLGPGANSLFSF